MFSAAFPNILYRGAFPCRAENSYEKGRDPLHLCPQLCAAQSWPGQLRCIQVTSVLPWISYVLWPLATCCPALGPIVLSLFILRGMDGALKSPGPAGSGIWGFYVESLLQEALWHVVQLSQGPSHGFLCHTDHF